VKQQEELLEIMESEAEKPERNTSFMKAGGWVSIHFSVFCVRLPIFHRLI
jgi:hypothetical protein